MVIGDDAPFAHRVFRELPQLLRPDDVLVMNNTKVLKAQLFGQKGAARIGVTLLKPLAADQWQSFVKNARRLRSGDAVTFGHGLTGTVLRKSEDGEVVWQFNQSGSDLMAALTSTGVMPLPPYIASRRTADQADEEDYQTVYAQDAGSVAAPTAGLHFTTALLTTLATQGLEQLEVTLHVGAGTFLPVKAEHLADHVMHAEWGEVNNATAEHLNRARAAGRRIIAVGTTTLRLLESATDATGRVQAFNGDTSIFIRPGYSFRCVDGLITNFHLPRSTLFMLVCALAGVERMHEAYRCAIEKGYRFYSYGDACLLWRSH